MTIFYHQQPQTSPNRCRFLASALKDAFSNCHTCKPRQSFSASEEDMPISDFDDEQKVIVSMVRSRAMEAKFRRRSFLLTDHSLSSVFYPTLGEVFVRATAKNKSDNGDDEERDEFLSVKSHFSVSCCASTADTEAFFSVNTKFSHCTSLNLDGLDYFPDLRRRSIIQEFCHCEGWPFGLCRKAVLLPALPKSPSESWSWHKGARTVKTQKISLYSQ